jgi:AcrR family transcriptional regulator
MQVAAIQAVKDTSQRDAKREKILDVARDIFLNEGYAASSMSNIAARLGGSKGTLYNYFRSKEELFEAYVRRHCDVLRLDMQSILNEGGTTRNVLFEWGLRFVTLTTSDQVIRHYRLILAEAERSPHIARKFYESGPLRGTEVLAKFMQTACERGDIVEVTSIQAAQHFVALCQHRHLKARLCNYAPEPFAPDIKADVQAAVDMFMRAYGRPEAPRYQI